MVSEIKEELGLDVSPDELKLILTKRVDVEHVIFDVYFMRKDIELSTLKIQAEELESVEWMSLDTIYRLIDQGLFLGSLADEVFGLVAKLD